MAELRDLARRVGGAHHLIAPTKRKDAEGMTHSEILQWLADDPKRLRRPIIDTGEQVHLGFTKAVRDALDRPS